MRERTATVFKNAIFRCPQWASTFRRVARLLVPSLVLALAACSSTCAGAGVTNRGTPDRESALLSRMTTAAACVDGERAMAHIVNILAFGERHAGTPGLEKTRLYIEESLTAIDLSPIRQSFVAHTPHPEFRKVSFANILADIGQGERHVILSGHFDGKIIDEGVFSGANDGGSSTGLLLEFARCLKQHPPDVPVRILFFDGEESLLEWSDSDGLYGSKYYVRKLLEEDRRDKIIALVNIDMVADPRLRFMQDTLSTPWVWRVLKQTGARLGYGDLFTGPVVAIGDDHQPFVEVGIPAAVLIDLQFGPGWNSNAYWHTDQDNLDNISADSMTVTGRIVLESLPDLFATAK